MYQEIKMYIGISEINKKGISEVIVKIIPNPIKDEATFEIELTKRNHIKISLLDVNGRIIEIITNQYLNKGTNKISWINNSGLNAGLYFIYVEDLSGVIISKKIILLEN